MRLRVDERGITLTAPRRATRGDLRRMLDDHVSWIERARAAVPAAPAGDGDAASRAAQARARRAARAPLVALVDRWAPVVGVVPQRVVVRAQRTRWGSASTRGTVSLNWRLVLTPPEVAEYVVVHELCHLVQMNHSPAFWALVEKHLPGYRGPRAWLREHGHAILTTQAI